MSMTATGIVRKVDPLGRVVIPKEIRNTFGLDEGQSLEIFIDETEGTVILRKYTPGCTVCGKVEGVLSYRNTRICPECIGKFTELLEA